LRNDRVQSIVQLLNSDQDVRRSLTGGLKREAHDIVSLQKRLRIVNVAGQVVDIDTGECIWLAGVATESEQFRIGEFCANGFRSKGQD
jgi:hypothetical protein